MAASPGGPVVHPSCNDALRRSTCPALRANGSESCQGHQVRLQKCGWDMRRSSSRRRRGGLIVAAAEQKPAGSTYESDGFSYLSMWKKAKERYDQEQLKQQRPNAPVVSPESPSWEQEIQMQREKEFARIMQVPEEERDRAHRKQVIDRAAAALAAAQALLASRSRTPTSSQEKKWEEATSRGYESGSRGAGDLSRKSVVVSAEPVATVVQTPGPDFWSWTPPPKGPEKPPKNQTSKSPRSESKTITAILEQERDSNMMLDIPFETEEGTPSLPVMFQSRAMPSLPPLQSLIETKETLVAPNVEVEPVIEPVPERAKLAAAVVQEDIKKNKSKKSETGVNPDGSRWWKESGEEDRGNGVTCNWTVTRGVNSQGLVEWEEKFWEACDDFDYKELGAEKSGRDASGNVWREFWKETAWQDTASGLLHIEKSAEKWGKNGKGGQWSEKWWERYDASGRAEKWADKWSQIDPSTQLEPGHAHVWHERWGEEFDGKGGAMKYTDKWAERAELGGWAKWGDKWDERFDRNAVGRKQGETWWEGANGERWNRTWGEEHNGTGTVHKYGQSSSGEQWDSHEQEETWYERFPHYGFHHCYENSQELRKVKKKKRL